MSKGFHLTEFHQILIIFEIFMSNVSFACSKCVMCGFSVFTIFSSFYEVFPIHNRNIESNVVVRIPSAKVSLNSDYFWGSYAPWKFCRVEMCNVRFLCFHSFLIFYEDLYIRYRNIDSHIVKRRSFARVSSEYYYFRWFCDQWQFVMSKRC